MLFSEIMSKVRSSFKGNKKTRKFIPNLSTSPNYICFKNYEEGKVYREQIRILNQDLKAYHLAIKFDSPEEIKLSIVGSLSKTRIDSGEDLLLEVEFRPTVSFIKESVDRRCEICLNIVNANAKFYIPVVVLSPNPVIHFPKEILLPDTAVNTPAYSNIFVLNCSKQFQKFTFENRSEIQIIPDCKTIGLRPADGSTYLVEFVPKTVGLFREKIQVCYDNGRKFAILLRCNVIPINIFLDEENVDFSPTFIGMTDMQEIHIVNNSEDASYFEWMPIELINNGGIQHQSTKYLKILPLNGELQPNTITTISFTFNPQDTDDDDYEILTDILFTFALKLSVELDYHPQIIVRGKIVGPNFQLDCKQIDLGAIYLGESRLIEVNVNNTGFINGKVLFQKAPSMSDGIVKVSSKSEMLKPGEVKNFKLKFLGRKAGRFVEQAFFKVKNGERLSFIVQGIIKPLEIIMEPKLIDFPAIPICVPQMQVLMLRNELPFEIDVELKVDNIGDDDPLEFLEFFSSHQIDPEFTVMSSESLASTSNSISIDSCSSILKRSVIRGFLENSGKLEHMQESIAAAQDGINSIYSRVDDYLEKTEIVQSILKIVSDGKINDELEKREIVDVIVDLLLEKIKNSELLDFATFDQKIWTIPERPREVELNVKFIKLAAKAPDNIADVKIFLTPNFIGKFTKHLKLKLLLSNLNPCPKQRVDETVINVPVTFDCQALQLVVHNEVNNISGYAESEIPLDILVENSKEVDGFFSFKHLADADMEVKSDEEKFHIAAGSKKIVKLYVTPLKAGVIEKCVNLVALGRNRKFPISIECKSLPPDIIIKPNKIFEHDLKVLEQHDSHIFIENRSTSKARFFVRLEHESEAFQLNPQGGILGSQQVVMITLEKKFYDPGEYKNILAIEIVNSKVIKIPVKCIVHKLPIIIEPEFSSIDFGTLFISKTPYFLEHTFTNRGRKPYVIFITLKSFRSQSETIFMVEPNRLQLAPNESQSVKFYLNAETPLNVDEMFTVEGCSTSFPMREIICESKLRACVIRPSLTFSQSELTFNFCYGDCDEDKSESIKIMNMSNLPLPITLKVEGEFYLLTQDQKDEQKVKFELKVKESRSIVVNFNRSLISGLNSNRSFEGKIKAYSLGKLQFTLNLQAHVLFPSVGISNCDLTIVNHMLPRAFTFTITNNGSIDATFSLNFKEASTIITKIQERKQEKLLNITQSLMKQTCDLKQKFFLAFKETEISAMTIDDLHELQDIEVDIKDEQTTDKSKTKLKPDKIEKQSKRESKMKENLNDKTSKRKLKEKETAPKDKPEVAAPIEEGNKSISADAKVIKLDFNELAHEVPEVTTNEILKHFKILTRGISEVLCNKDKIRSDHSVEVKSSTESINDSAGKCLKLSQVEGCLKPEESRPISVFFAGSNEAFHLSTILTCNILGAISHEIIINFTNCNPNVLVTKTHFEMPDDHRWDEILSKNICVSNMSPARNRIRLITPVTDEKHDLTFGYVKLNSKTDKDFILDDQRNFCSDIKFSIFTGCCGTFKSEFAIQVNENPPIPITFFGKNQLQNATLLDVNHKSLHNINKNFEYCCLSEMFKLVNRIHVPDQVVAFEDILKIKMQLKAEQEMLESLETKTRRRTLKKKKISDKESMMSCIEQASGDSDAHPRKFGLFYNADGSVNWREKQLQKYTAKILLMIDEDLENDGFEVLDYPDEFPQAVEITNFIAQQGFVKSLQSDGVFQEFKSIYKRHVLQKRLQEKTKKNADRVGAEEDEGCVVPLPLIVQHYEVDLGEIQLNQKAEQTLQFYFHGIKLAASLRAERFVPGLLISFVQLAETQRCYKVVDHEVTCEENFATNEAATIKRCHSFDFTIARVHARKIPTPRERITIHKSYNEFMSTKNNIEKSKFVSSEIFQNAIDDRKIFDFKIELTPASDIYEADETFDETVYLDFHLGAQIPINIKAKIVAELQPQPEDESVLIES